jgi:hypothetical protein
MVRKTSTPIADQIVGCLCFERPGPQNTERTLEWAAVRARELGVAAVLVASSSGATAVKALRYFDARGLVVVTHSTGFSAPNLQELKPANRRRLEEAGARILTAQHAFGGVGRAVRKKLGTYELEEIMAFTLRTFGQGAKVAVEIGLMAADAGLVPTGAPVISIGGTESGADTALLLRPANAQTFFELRVMEILAKPR